MRCAAFIAILFLSSSHLMATNTKATSLHQIQENFVEWVFKHKPAGVSDEKLYMASFFLLQAAFLEGAEVAVREAFTKMCSRENWDKPFVAAWYSHWNNSRIAIKNSLDNHGMVHIELDSLTKRTQQKMANQSMFFITDMELTNEFVCIDEAQQTYDRIEQDALEWLSTELTKQIHHNDILKAVDELHLIADWDEFETNFYDQANWNLPSEYTRFFIETMKAIRSKI